MLRPHDLLNSLSNVFGQIGGTSALTQTEGSGSRLSLSRMVLAGLVQTNGVASPLCSWM